MKKMMMMMVMTMMMMMMMMTTKKKKKKTMMMMLGLLEPQERAMGIANAQTASHVCQVSMTCPKQLPISVSHLAFCLMGGLGNGK